MNIKLDTNLSPVYKNIKTNNSYASFNKLGSTSDTFEISQNNNKNVSFKAGFLSRLFAPKQQPQTDFTIPTPYIASLQKGMNEVFGEYLDMNIPTKNYSNIVSPEKFKEILPTLNIRNFDKNNKDSMDPNGIYCADLDCPTTYSTGKKGIHTLLEEVVEYADEYHEKTGKKFLFALTDRDTVEGVQHAIRILVSDPEKYKNIEFVPSMKMTFSHKINQSQSRRFENSEMIIYGINPFSPKLIELVNNTLDKRAEMISRFIFDVKELYPEFFYNISEFAKQKNIELKKDYAESNLYWRTREYVETKNSEGIRSIELSPDETVAAAIYVINELANVERGTNNRDYSALSSRIIMDDEVNKTIKGIFKKYVTHEEGKDIVSEAENTTEEMMDVFKAEEIRPVMAIAAPYYLSHYFPDEDPNSFEGVVNFLKKIQEQSDGMLVAFESKAPKYRLDDKLFKRPNVEDYPIDDPFAFNKGNEKFFRLKEQPILEIFNNYLRNNKDLNLYEVGGSWHDPYMDKELTVTR